MADPNGTITFVPLAGFDGDPTPVHYQLQTVDSDTVAAQVTVSYSTLAGLAFTGFSDGWTSLLGLLRLGAGTIARGSCKLLRR